MFRPIDTLQNVEHRIEIEQLFKRAHLNARQERVLRLHFGLGGERLTLKQCGELLGISGSRVLGIEYQAIHKIRHRFGRDYMGRRRMYPPYTPPIDPLERPLVFQPAQPDYVPYAQRPSEAINSAGSRVVIVCDGCARYSPSVSRLSRFRLTRLDDERARAAARLEGWRCDQDGDHCPRCRRGVSNSPNRPAAPSIPDAADSRC